MQVKQRLWIYYLLFFFLALTIHLIGLNKIGRTWDEEYKVDYGYIAWTRIMSGDVSLKSWNIATEHPMVAKYIYGLFFSPDLVYIQGQNGPAQFTADEAQQLNQGNYIPTQLYGSLYLAPYDFTLPRIASAICNSLAIILTVIIASYIVGPIAGFLAGIFLLVTPQFVFLGQLVTFESISVFFFCAIILCCYQYLKHSKSLKHLLFLGIISGLFFWTRYNNIIVFPFLIGWMFIHDYFHKQKSIIHYRLLLIPFIAILLGIMIWPLTWHEFPKYLLASFQFHEHRFIGLSFYYAKYFLVTTPVPILVGLLLGLFFCVKKRGYWQIVILWWFLCVLIIYSVFVIPTGGTRYAVILYPVISIIATYGYAQILKNKYIFLLIPLIIFMVIDQFRIFPYYLDYYNQLVGGPAEAAKKGYQFSWWGEGQREAGLWLNEHANTQTSVSLMVTPKYVFPKLRSDLQFKGYIEVPNDAQYTVVSRTNERTLSPDFYRTHQLIYSVKVDNESLVNIWKKR